MDRSPTELDALVVLGCRARAGAPSPTLERRLRWARQALRHHPARRVVMSGGKLWEGMAEATVMAEWWTTHTARPNRADVDRPDEDRADEPELLLELRSMTTRQNAACAAHLLLPLGVRRIGLVTCDFHMRRAARCFVRRGFEVLPLAAPSEAGLARRLRLWGRERLAACLSAFEVDP